MARNRSVFAHTLETIAPLHERYISGEDPGDLAAELGISRGALLSQFHHKGLGGREKRHWWTVREMQDAKKRITSGETLSSVATRLKVAPQRLYRALLKSGFNPTPYLKRPKRKTRESEDMRIFNMRKTGLTYAQIAANLGWPTSLSGQRRVGRRIKRYCDKVGIPIPLVGEVLRRDGTRRRVGYSQKVRDAVKRDMTARLGKDFT